MAAKSYEILYIGNCIVFEATVYIFGFYEKIIFGLNETLKLRGIASNSYLFMLAAEKLVHYREIREYFYL